MANRLFIVGVGAEGRPSLTARAAEIVDRAELLVGGARHLAMFPEVTAERVTMAGGLAAAMERMESALDSRRVVVLASGDPGFFGIARPLAERFGRERVEIIPNVSSLQLAFAHLGESWEDAAFASVHGRPLEGLRAALAGSRKVAILTGGKNTAAAVAQWLLDSGLQGYRVYLCEELGGPEERIREYDLPGLAGVETSLLNVVVLIKRDAPVESKRGCPEGAASPVWRDSGCPQDSTLLLSGESERDGGTLRRGCIPDEEFLHRSGMITKAEVRVVSLAKLRLGERSIVWDVGAGSGSVAVEAAIAARLGRVYAVERDADQLRMIEMNLAHFALDNVEIIHGQAPAALDGVPDPDAVFIGGSGGQLASILEAACSRLRAGGRVVVNAATLESVGVATATLRQQGFEAEVTLLQISRGKGAGSLTRLEALNPVFIVAGGRDTASIPVMED